MKKDQKAAIDKRLIYDVPALKWIRENKKRSRPLSVYCVFWVLVQEIVILCNDPKNYRK
ncbi:hypothetical protein ABES02_26400 [Neobacillus pocheonensis]|uniref:hypothetical protein n=1 Tax=Neobacillus pocheonensis TaxID=363869 RepID=UPI003D29FD12